MQEPVRQHYKLEYADDSGAIQTLVGYSMWTAFPQVAEDWVKSVQPRHPGIRLRLGDPTQQAIAEATRGLDENGDDYEGLLSTRYLRDDGFYDYRVKEMD